MSREYDERSADMRLVELQRRRLQLPERPIRWAQDPQALEETFTGAPRVDLATPQIEDALILGSLHASPARGLISGALVTVALIVENAGGAAANVRARLSLSLDAGYRPGTTVLDGRELADLDEGSVAFSPGGADLGTIAPGERRRLSVTVKLGPSTEPFRATAHLEAGRAPTLGVAPLEIERARGTSAFAQAVLQRLAEEPAATPSVPEPPPYELKPEEEIVYEAADAALSSTPAIEPEPEPEPAPTQIAWALPTEPPPVVPAAVEAHAQAAATGSLGCVLWNTVDASTVRFLGRVLRDGSSLGLLGHFMVANGLIVRFAPLGAGVGDSLGLGKFSSEQAGLLNRLMLQARMKRATSLEHYATPPPVDRLAQIERLPQIEGATLASALPAAQTGSLVLYATLSSSELAFLTRTASTEKTPPFVRNRQVAAALLPRRARSEQGELEDVGRLLTAYAEASVAAITRFFVQLRLQPSLLPTVMRDPELEKAAEELLAGLGSALTGQGGA